MKSSDFIENVRRTLGRDASVPVVPVEATHLSLTQEEVGARAKSVAEYAKANAEELLSHLEVSAAEAGWNVVRVSSAQEAAQYIRKVAIDTEARDILRSRHEILEQLGLEEALSDTGVELGVMAISDDATESERVEQRQQLRQKAIHTDIGLTGVDYAIAETGTCVLLPRKGVSRVVSLLPPVHIAVVESGQVLPSLDELFTMRRQAFYQGDLGSYMNFISGPSRSADIEYQLVTGVHGPGEVHMILIG